MTQELWAKFNADGEAEWFGYPPIEGSELLTDTPFELLVAHRRVRRLLPGPHYVWLPREKKLTPAAAVDEEADKLAALAAKADAEEARLQAIELEVARLSAPDVLLRSCGKITIAELNSRVDTLRAKLQQVM